MGKGDRKSRRGKIFMGSYGKTRPARKRKVKVIPVAVPVEAPVATPAKKKAPAKKKTPAKKKQEKS